MDQPVDAGREPLAERDGHVSAERVQRGTFITRLAMGLGVGVLAAAGAAVAPARASVAARQRSRAGRVARPKLRKGAQSVDNAADFAVQGTSYFSDVVSFARSGAASIGAGHSSATVTGVSLSSTSLVFATIQNQVAGSGAGLWVQAVVPNVAAGSFTIFLSQRVPYRQTVQIGWFIAN